MLQQVNLEDVPMGVPVVLLWVWNGSACGERIRFTENGYDEYIPQSDSWQAQDDSFDTQFGSILQVTDIQVFISVTKH